MITGQCSVCAVFVVEDQMKKHAQVHLTEHAEHYAQWYKTLYELPVRFETTGKTIQIGGLK